jgi:paraquat-inducible protein A
MVKLQHTTARQAGLSRCHDCAKLVKLDSCGTNSDQECPRCSAKVHLRKPNSLNRTWALVTAALIMLFPANILPIMEVSFLGDVERSTILDGILYFFDSGSYGIGIIILTASVLVPLFKVTGLILILLSLHFRWRSWLRHKTVMFRFICFIGRWSMLDIFVIAILSVLVKFGTLSTTTAAPAVTYFAGVVVLTMLAAATFDSRLLWDTCADDSKSS